MAQGLRVRDGSIEAKCDYCLDWWPLVDETGVVDAQFWMPKQGFRKCYACYREARAAYLRSIRENPEIRARHKASSDETRALKKAADPEHIKRVQHEWYVRNAEEQRANRRARYAAKKALEGKVVQHYGPTEDLIAEAQRLRNRKYKTDWQRAERAARKAAEARAA
jgi:hypothetical protein